mgnify:CR=1 FL=1
MSYMTNPAKLAHESNAASYNNAFPVVVDRAKGSLIYAEDGTEYIDFFSGAGANNYGHNPDVLKTALLDYITRDGINNSLDIATVVKREFVDTYYLHILQPRGLDYKLMFTGPTGTNAVEAALKRARKVKGRSEIIAFKRGFHGVSLGSLATTSNEYFRQAAGVPLEHVTFFPYDRIEASVEGSIAELEAAFADIDPANRPAGAIVEVIQGEGGVNAARPEWIQRLRELTTEHDMLLIVDDIQAGCGRSGNFFSFEPSGIAPDVITQSKSISGYGSPMSLVLIKPEYDAWKPAEHNGTFLGNNHPFPPATAAINTYWRDDSLMRELADKAGLLKEALDGLVAEFPEAIIEHRGRGFLQGIVFADPAVAADVSKRAFEKHLIIERAGVDDEVVKFMPALTIDEATLREGISRVVDAVREAIRGARGESTA